MLRFSEVQVLGPCSCSSEMGIPPVEDALNYQAIRCAFTPFITYVS